MTTGKPAVQCGVYRAPAEVLQLRRRFASAGCAWFNLELARVRDKAALLSECGRALGLPNTFGANWDALADTLQDWSWQPAPGYALHLRDVATLSAAAPEDYRQLLDILRDAADYWSQRAKPFVVLVDGDADLPAYRD